MARHDLRCETFVGKTHTHIASQEYKLAVGFYLMAWVIHTGQILASTCKVFRESLNEEEFSRVRHKAQGKVRTSSYYTV